METSYYPLFLSLEGLHVLILGFGEVGRRKLTMLLPAKPATVLIVDPLPPGALGKELLLQAQASGIRMTTSREPFQEAMLGDVQLVFLCTSNTELNERVARLCKTRHILCNCTDHPSLGSFHVPAQVHCGLLCAALSTSGASPALARRWKTELGTWLEHKGPIVELMRRLRPLVLELKATATANRELFRALADRSLEDALAEGNLSLARDLLAKRLPAPLCRHIEELLHDLDTVA